VHLGNLVGKHVPVVVVGRHPKATLGPANDLHGGGVADEVLQVAAAVLEQASCFVLGFVVLVEHPFHDAPKPFLPLEHRLLGDHVRHNLGVKAAAEEVVREVAHVVKGVVVNHRHVLVVAEGSAVHHVSCRRVIFRQKSGHQLAPAAGLPASTVLAAHCVPLEEHGLFEPELDAVNVNGVAGNRDPIPAPTHGPVRRAPRFLQAHLLLLHSGWRDGGLFENGANVSARCHRIVQHFVFRRVARLATQVKSLPC